MYTPQLDQILIVQPSCAFVDIARVLGQMGWQRDPLDMAAPSLIRDEPEVATWSWGGNKPYVVYTFNPVVKMRVLEVATLPPALRAALAERLPLLDKDAIAQLFESDDIRDRLLGLWCAQETERVDLLDPARRLTHDAEPILAEQAKDVCAKLERINQARTELLINMKLLSEAAPSLIRRLQDRAFVQSLKPSREDLIRLFDPILVDSAARAVEQMYADPKLVVQRMNEHTRLDVFAAPAGILRWPNMLSNKFPGGYRDIAGWLTPACIWMCWKQIDPNPVTGETATMSYDGLVWLDDHWLWMPKIFRFLTPYLMQTANASMSTH